MIQTFLTKEDHGGCRWVGLGWWGRVAVPKEGVWIILWTLGLPADWHGVASALTFGNSPAVNR